MVLTADQRQFWDDNGYIICDEPLLSSEQLKMLEERITDIAKGRLTHVPEEHFTFEQAAGHNGDSEEARYNSVRNIAFLHRHDDVVREIAQSPRIVDIVQDILGPNIKMYTDQFFMKPPFHGSAQHWHQDSETWTFFAPHDHVTCWIGIDEATVENGCLHYLPGSHKLGYIPSPHVPIAVEQLKDSDVAVPRKPGYGVFHHSLLFHQTGPNTTPNRRRGIALHYIRAATRYLGIPGERLPRIKPPYLLIRGEEIPGRV